MTIAQQLIEQGREEGEKEGRTAERIAIARTMLANGVELEFVGRQVNLPLEELMILRDELLSG